MRRNRQQGAGRLWPRHGLRFAEDNKLALLNTFFSTPKRGVSYTFQNANRGKCRLHPDEAGGPPTRPLRQCPTPPFGVTGIGS